jgi:PadR family transcriptional regulator, regulatory protein PadR
MIASSDEVIMPARIPERLFHGTLDALILKALADGARHGYDIASWIEATSGAALTIEDAALYTALHKMEERGWIEAEWGLSAKKKRAKYYRLTTAGRRQMLTRVREWASYVEAVDRILRPGHLAPSPA